MLKISTIEEFILGLALITAGALHKFVCERGRNLRSSFRHAFLALLGILAPQATELHRCDVITTAESMDMDNVAS